MDNPNNAWAFPPPPPPGYAPPPPPPKGLLAPPRGKRRGLALAMVCLMALAALLSAVMPFFAGDGLIGGMLSDPLYLGLDAANLLLALLVYLKFALPGWEPHRKALGWLLGASMVCSLAFGCYAVLHGMRIGFSAAGEAFGAGADAAVMAGARIGALISALAGVGMNPFLYLLVGACAKKSMEKIAGVLAAVSLGSALLSIPISLLTSRLAAEALEMPTSLWDPVWATAVPALASAACAVVFYFSWPVLERPVLEKT
jgi:hypothetical protein